MALIYLVRHGQASFGSADYDRLSELGWQQSRWLGEYFSARGLRFARAMSGTLVRQRDTAIGILEAMGAGASPGTDALMSHAGLNEYHGDQIYHAYTGGADIVAHQRRDFRDYWRTFRLAMDAWSRDALAPVPETWTQFGDRVRSALDQVSAGLDRNDAVLVVSSGGAIGRGVGQILGAPAATAIELNLQFRNTGYCELIVGGGTLRLSSFNNAPHLDAAERRHALTFA